MWEYSLKRDVVNFVRFGAVAHLRETFKKNLLLSQDFLSLAYSFQSNLLCRDVHMSLYIEKCKNAPPPEMR